MDAFIRERVHRYYWRDDINCATTALKVLGERFAIPLSDQVLQAAVGLHGAGGLGAQCGLVDGTLMFLGIAAKRAGASDAEAARRCRGFAHAFHGRFGSLRCAVLRPEGFAENLPPHLCEGLTCEALALAIRFVSVSGPSL
jgi:hypothetical protein